MATINSNAGASADNQFLASNGTNNAIMSMKGTGFTTSGIFSANNAFFGGTGTSSTNLYSTNGNVNIFPASTLVATFTTTGLGIGTSSPAVKLDVVGAVSATGVIKSTSNTNGQFHSQPATTSAAATFLAQNAGGTAYFGKNNNGGGAFGGTTYSTVVYSGGAVPMQFYTNDALQATLDSSGNLGLGVTPSAWATYTSVLQSGRGSFTGTAAQTTLTYNAYYNAGWKYVAGGDYAQLYEMNNVSGAHTWKIAPNTGTTGGTVSFTQAMTLDASSRLSVGTTSANGQGTFSAGANRNGLWVENDTYDYQTLTLYNKADANDNIFAKFGTESASFNARGSITYNRAGGLVAYNTTSDYRAKDISGPVTNSGALIDSVPVYMGKMKDATQERPMFIAHEVPAYAHTGEKDAVDADGNPVYQQMDASALIPVMWAEIQSLRQRLSAANL
jgi:hypothetical protein